MATEVIPPPANLRRSDNSELGSSLAFAPGQTMMVGLGQIVEKSSAEGALWGLLDGYRIRCTACAHRCPIPVGFAGVCKVRFNRRGKLYVPWSYVVDPQLDPIEKKPFFHVLPGALAFTFGMLGCNLHCPYCQNWFTSQALRDPNSYASPVLATPEELVQRAIQQGAEVVVSSYNEPLITAEWAVAIFRKAREAGLLTGMVSNGYATPEVLEYLRPWVDLLKVDLKTFNDAAYHKLGARLQPVLESIKLVHEMGFWLEVVTLVVPGFNDSEKELNLMAEFLASISPDIPWHVTAFYPDYKMQTANQTSAADLERAAEIGRRAGLRYVYAGNLTGRVGKLENTYCPRCGYPLIKRTRDKVAEDSLTPDGRCPKCSSNIPGVWTDPLRRRIPPRTDLPRLARQCG
jgi:pyruvate formate lyase activating enzyme